MAYCRWSSNNFMCDLYVYMNCNGGWTIHVANNRTIKEPPKVDWNLIHDEKKWKLLNKQRAKQSRFLDKAKRAKIGLKHDGESFYNLDYESTLKTLKMLHNEGYRFDYFYIAKAIIEDHIEEEKENGKTKKSN